MNIKELEERFREEGCNPGNYCIGAPWEVTDIYCLEKIDGEWCVYFTERGRKDPPIFVSQNEAKAGEFYFREIMSIRHDHCVGFFAQEQNAAALIATLNEHGVAAFQDAVPVSGWHDPRYRIWVTGKAIFKAREILGTEQIRDD